ncbi:MAG: site-specific DNA-methyltransferase [Oscillospiraceae bacterium]|nr:site-specific DNA-methyltransferase [Oscillospiraceae bacterium]
MTEHYAHGKLCRVTCGNAIECLRELPPNIFDCCITSPPYFGLRDYGIAGQIGLEDSPDNYINALVEVFGELKRVLKDDGTLWVVIGDSYAGSGKGGQSKSMRSENWKPDYANKSKTYGLKTKDLIGIPWLLAFALRNDGWYLRQDIIWHKPNVMPESVRDRCTRSHEYIFMFSKSARYYYNNDTIKEPIAESTKGRKTATFGGEKGRNYTPNKSDPNYRSGSDQWGRVWENNSDTRNKRSVWTVATKPLKESHYAAFPTELIKPCILASSKHKGIVLDPFCGSGTTGITAWQLGRAFHGIDINPDYCKLTIRRLRRLKSIPPEEILKF